MADIGQSLVAQAARAAAANGTEMADELMRLEDKRRISQELNESKSQEGRKAAERAAQTSTQQGVKTTKYPYVEPAKPSTSRGTMRGGGGGGGGGLGVFDLLKKGGKVKGYAKGGSIDGCAQRGKTKGRVI